MNNGNGLKADLWMGRVRFGQMNRGVLKCLLALHVSILVLGPDLLTGMGIFVQKCNYRAVYI